VGIAVLGPLRIDEGGVSLAPRDRVVLAALTVFVGEEVSAERLADALWGDQPPASWGKVVPGCVMRLRRVLGAKAIETTPCGYRLVIGVEEVDTGRFERLVERAHELLGVGEPDRAAHLFGEALALWRGGALIDVEDWGPGRVEAGRLGEVRLSTEEALLEARLQTGQHWEVLAEAQARVGEAPLRERRWALLARAQYRAGRQAEALSSLRRARTDPAYRVGVGSGTRADRFGGGDPAPGSVAGRRPSVGRAERHLPLPGACPVRRRRRRGVLRPRARARGVPALPGRGRRARRCGPVGLR
jgi:DNA-binding SARP family transcriptional activator